MESHPLIVLLDIQSFSSIKWTLLNHFPFNRLCKHVATTTDRPINTHIFYDGSMHSRFLLKVIFARFKIHIFDICQQCLLPEVVQNTFDEEPFCRARLLVSIVLLVLCNQFAKGVLVILLHA
jgi:hypothetical protein